MATRLEHANIAVRDIDEMIRFLRVAFEDFEHRAQGKDPLGRRWVHIGTPESYIAISEACEDPTSKRRPYSNLPGMNHLGYVVEDVTELRQRMLAAGYRETTIPNAHPHRTRIYFNDREENDWEFVEYNTDDIEKRNDYSDVVSG